MMMGTSRVSRSRLSARVSSSPLISGSIQSTRTRSGLRSAKSARALAAVLGLPDLEARAFEAERDHLANRPFILDDQYLFGWHYL